MALKPPGRRRSTDHSTMGSNSSRKSAMAPHMAMSGRMEASLGYLASLKTASDPIKNKTNRQNPPKRPIWCNPRTQEDHPKFKDSLPYRVNSRLAWTTEGEPLKQANTRGLVMSERAAAIRKW